MLRDRPHGLMRPRAVPWFEGNWTEYEADYHKRNGVDADNPKPIRYKTLTR